MDANKLQILKKSIARHVDRDNVAGIVELITCSDPSNKLELITLLEEMTGKKGIFNSILLQFWGSSNEVAKNQPSRKIDSSNKKDEKKRFGGNNDRNKCGCMASSHRFYANCTNCGLIHCEEEVVDLCLFCNSALEPPFDAQEAQNRRLNADTIQAYATKDRLLMYDKENTKRTNVKDAQVPLPP